MYAAQSFHKSCEIFPMFPLKSVDKYAHHASSLLISVSDRSHKTKSVLNSVTYQPKSITHKLQNCNLKSKQTKTYPLPS
jgi:hypothetical protein